MYVLRQQELKTLEFDVQTNYRNNSVQNTYLKVHLMLTTFIR